MPGWTKIVKKILQTAKAILVKMANFNWDNAKFQSDSVQGWKWKEEVGLLKNDEVRLSSTRQAVYLCSTYFLVEPSSHPNQLTKTTILQTKQCVK